MILYTTIYIPILITLRILRTVHDSLISSLIHTHCATQWNKTLYYMYCSASHIMSISPPELLSLQRSQLQLTYTVYMLFVREAYMFCVMSSKPLSRVFFLRKITLPCDQCYHIYTQTFNFNNSQRQCYSFKFTLFKILLNTTCPSRYDHRMLF